MVTVYCTDFETLTAIQICSLIYAQKPKYNTLKKHKQQKRNWLSNLLLLSQEIGKSSLLQPTQKIATLLEAQKTTYINLLPSLAFIIEATGNELQSKWTGSPPLSKSGELLQSLTSAAVPTSLGPSYKNITTHVSLRQQREKPLGIAAACTSVTSVNSNQLDSQHQTGATFNTIWQA